MLRAGEVAEAIRLHRLIVILRRVEPRSRLLELVDDLADTGARVFEITFDAPSAADDVAELRSHLAARADGPYLVGAGTLVSEAQLSLARSAGADFGVSPLFDPPLVRRALENAMPFVPGAFSPSEIAAAWATGATLVKLFPASSVGPQFVRELRGPLPEIQLIPTGGIDGSNAASFLEAGAVAVGIGSALTRSEAEARRRIVAGLRRG
jgi:2-dehydro-3-deoxyphosphogluconate aldolase / (4S)-4-hydroxy-2-oxoglutarate aldolase